MFDFVGLTEALAANKDQAYSGTGMVFYDSDRTLSQYHCDLVEAKLPDFKELFELDKLVAYLLKISNYQHPYHDGFHFINCQGRLTHVAQFFSPPILESEQPIQGQGARTYCALLGAQIKGVIMTASISSNGKTCLFRKSVNQVAVDTCKT